MSCLKDLCQIICFFILVYIVASFKPLTPEEQVESFEKMNESVEPFRKNLTECARQVKASMVDVQNFLKRIPQSTLQGKCFVACVLKRAEIITKNKINRDNLVEINKNVYGEDSHVVDRVKDAVSECGDAVDNIFEICEYASVFNDCMHMKMEHILDKATMDRRMEALGHMTSNPDEWGEDEDEIMQLVREEL